MYVLCVYSYVSWKEEIFRTKIISIVDCISVKDFIVWYRLDLKLFIIYKLKVVQYQPQFFFATQYFTWNSIFCAVLLPKCCHANQSCVNRFSPWQLYYSHSNNIGNISAESKSAYFAMVLSFVPGLLSYAWCMYNVYILWFWNVIYTICNIHSTYV